jgi:hypothetical protein
MHRRGDDGQYVKRSARLGLRSERSHHASGHHKTNGVNRNNCHSVRNNSKRRCDQFSVHWVLRRTTMKYIWLLLLMAAELSGQAGGGGYTPPSPVTCTGGNCSFPPNSNVTIAKTLSAGALISGQSASTSQLVCDGDSQTVSFNTSYCSLLSLNETFTTTNTAVDARQISDMITAAPASVYPLFTSMAKRNIDSWWGGTNNLFYGGTPASALAQALAYAADAHKAGFKVAALTALSRTGTGVGGASLDSLTQQYNGLLRAYSGYFDIFIDIAANANLGAVGAYANTTYFLVDGTHLTLTGNTLVASIASAAINAYLANNPVYGPENLIPYSALFGDTGHGWALIAAAVGTGVIAPDGSASAIHIYESDTTNAYHVLDNQYVVAPAGAVITLSAVFQAAERIYAGMIINDGSLYYSDFNLATGAVGTVSSGATATITPVQGAPGSGWYLCTMTRTIAAANPTVYFRPQNTTGATTYVGVVGDGVNSWNPQVNYGSTVTPYLSNATGSGIVRPGLALTCPSGQTAKPTSIIGGSIMAATCS